MRNTFIVFGLVLLCGAMCAAQEIPKAEVYLGYSFLRVNSAISVPAFTANGGLGSFQYNLNKNFAVVGEFGGHHNGNINGVQLDSTMFTYLFGPRISVHKSGRISPFFHGLFGGMHYTRSIAVNPTVNPLTNRIKNSQDAFAMAFGGGIDFKLNRRIAFRPIQLDYLMTRFQPLFISGLGDINRDRNQNNLRYSAGIAFRF